MPEKKKGPLLALYSLGHFLVDMTCAYVLFSLSPSEYEGVLTFLLYNFCAFALQMPLGLLADRLNRNGILASLGLLLTSAAFLSMSLPLLCALLLGTGNALYHIGGGVEVLHFEEKKQWMLGVFVSPGALGLFAGTLLGRDRLLQPLSMALILLASTACVVLGLHLLYPLQKPSGNVAFSIGPRGHAPIIAALCLLGVVVLRSYVGVTADAPWESQFPLSLLSLLGLVLGKTAGGLLADRFGALSTALLSLGLSSVLFLFYTEPVCGILAVFLFNMSMPLSLFAMAKLFPGARGFAFGTLTFALFLGCLPALLPLSLPLEGGTWLHGALSAVSMLLLTVGLLCGRERRSSLA